MLALKPSDYDNKSEILHIQRTLTRDKDDKIIIGNTTKTYKGDRKIPVTDEFKQDLLLAIKNMIPNKFDLVFTHKDGKFINPVTYNTVFKRICKNLNIENVTAYTLRHSFATRRLESHMDIKLLAELMGHSDIDTIYKNYVTILEDFKHSELKRYYRYAETVGLYKSNDTQENIKEIVDLIKNLYIEDPKKLIKKLSTVKIL